MLALALLAIFGRGLVTVVIAVGIVYATRTARIAYSLTLTIREETYVQSARATGVGTLQILTKHILLNAVSPLIVQGTFVFAFSILEVASLNFLGIGIPPYIPSWGADMSLSRVYMTRAPWTLIFPGLFIIASVLSLNLMGDALRDVLDPRLKNIL
jgi:peptide/nickel transport system permease protein